MILSLSCDIPEFLNAIVLFKRILLLIQILAPIVLVVVSGIDIIKAVMAGNSDEIMKHVHKIPRRLLSLSVVYLAPLVINLGVSLAQDVSEYSECYNKATEENVLIAYQNKAEELISIAEKEKTRKAVSDAKGYLYRISDEDLKKALTLRADKVLASIKQKEKIEEEERRLAFEEKMKEYSRANANLILNVGNYANSNGGRDNPLGIPYYNQCDPRWTNYKNYNSCGLACGFVSIAMAVSGITNNTNITPITIFDDFNLAGTGINFEYTNNGNDLNRVISKYNVESKILWECIHHSVNCNYSTTQQLQAMKDALKKGHPIVLNVPNHYIAIVGYDNNGFYVHDPGAWELNRCYSDQDFLNTFLGYHGQGYGLKGAYEFYKKGAY